jgi:hypothetical protein
MGHETEAFDIPGFLDLLGEVMNREVAPDSGTGVVSVRIHVRDGTPWAMSVQFDNAEARAA